MRIDAPGKYSAAFYNSVDKPIVGSTDWQLRSVTLDVPADASTLSFGVIDAGTGQVWIDQLSLESVGRDVAVDLQPARSKLPVEPSLKPLHVVAVALTATSLWVVAAESVGKLPAPWFISGDRASSYQSGLDNVETSSGKGAKFIRYAQGDDKGFGTLAQVISAQRYIGQRVRFRAMIKTRDVSNWAGLWMTVHGQNRANASFYNSSDQPIKGTTRWQMRSVTLDVPEDGASIVFGVINSGSGQVWIDELSFEVVGKDKPVDQMPSTQLPETPVL